MWKSRKQKMNFYSFNLNKKKGEVMHATKNKRSNVMETKSLSKSLKNLNSYFFIFLLGRIMNKRFSFT